MYYLSESKLCIKIHTWKWKDCLLKLTALPASNQNANWKLTTVHYCAQPFLAWSALLCYGTQNYNGNCAYADGFPVLAECLDVVMLRSFPRWTAGVSTHSELFGGCWVHWRVEAPKNVAFFGISAHTHWLSNYMTPHRVCIAVQLAGSAAWTAGASFLYPDVFVSYRCPSP